jgi:hypothetical protein
LNFSHKLEATKRNPRPRLVRLRSVVARVMIAALVLPTIFPLTGADPEWVLGVNLTSRESGERAAAHHHEAADPGKDYSDIPGAPGHPADHNCQPCQVLKSLVSYLPQLPFSLPSSAPRAVPSSDRAEPQCAGHIASLPPSRAPPQAAV